MLKLAWPGIRNRGAVPTATGVRARALTIVACAIVLCALGSLAGCSSAAPALIVDGADNHFEDDPAAELLSVPGNTSWIDTGMDFAAGEVLTLTARGRITIGEAGESDVACPTEVGPAGTYLFSDAVAHCPFPLPAAARGPAPCYCLIARVGDGPAFFAGERCSRRVSTSGRLYLGVNDFAPEDNGGEFLVQVSRGAAERPIAFREQAPPGPSASGPVENASVVVFYLDGLRPDVVLEMAAMGHIPTINRLFVEGGAWPRKTFTGFPSDTITSNGTMWTGCFSDRHGLKGQVRFSRRTLVSESYLEPLGPNRSARLLAPQGIDKIVHKTGKLARTVVHGADEAERWDRAHTTGVRPLYQHLRDHGRDWATGVLPMMTEVPPLLWTRSMVRHMPYLHSQDGYRYIDEANAHYAVRHLLAHPRPVTIIWMPETDSISHKASRGQFGMTRRTIAEADRLIANVVDELRAQCRLDSTYLFLVSDHGHHGGQWGYLRNFDLANEFFHRPREVSPDGEWIGGGLGISVRQHRIWNRHPEDHTREFVFFDGDSAGAARIFLPRRRFRSRDWISPARPADLLAYCISEKHPPVNLPEALAHAQLCEADGVAERPVDLVLMRAGADSLLITTADRGQAVIERIRDEAGRWLYRYSPVTNVRPCDDGTVHYDILAHPETDPLGLVAILGPQTLAEFHDEQTWLELTADATYPDGVVAMTRHMLWQENLHEREQEFAPDLVVTARPGWYFGGDSSPGTMHGYPLADAMRATLFVTGPNIRRGAELTAPARLADLTPTILQMVGMPYHVEEFDGRALTGIYQDAPDHCAAAGPCATPAVASRAAAGPGQRPVFWDEVDLHAWGELEYRPVRPYPYRPWTINRPASFCDLNNIAYNVLSVSDINVLRVLDDVLAPLAGGSPGLLAGSETLDQRARRRLRPGLGGVFYVLDAPSTTLGDYSPYSLGNLKRADRAVDWLQERSQRSEARIGSHLGCGRPPGAGVVHGAIDGAQDAFWETYRFGQRVLVQTLDEKLLNCIENTTDRAVNHFRQAPAEIVVERPMPVLQLRTATAPSAEENP